MSFQRAEEWLVSLFPARSKDFRQVPYGLVVMHGEKEVDGLHGTPLLVAGYTLLIIGYSLLY
ncbi:MAG: hypothetical protein AMJ94_19705 [Deltaproteobacteria bacterium SM23_61]|nr:MAG: hypothetical protein AMJ94_19705 [Deltaproteobacteria bacterium SM23_61]